MAIRALLDFLYEEKYAAERELNKLKREANPQDGEDSQVDTEEHKWRTHFQWLDRHELVSAVRYRHDVIDKAIDLAIATVTDGQNSNG